MIINIKNMVCQRCVIIVNNILHNFGLEAIKVTKGQVVLKQNIVDFKLKQLDEALKATGLEIIFDKKSLLVQKIKNIIFDVIYCLEEPLPVKFSCYLSQQLNYSYTYLASIFSQQSGISIERYILEQKIEKVKSMLLEQDFFLNEIAYKMNYSSVSHLSNQFKKITGISPSKYKYLKTTNGGRLFA
jgi:AraC-like DNA-binding protein